MQSPCKACETAGNSFINFSSQQHNQGLIKVGRILEFITFYQNAFRHEQLIKNTRKLGGWERASFAAHTVIFLFGKFSTARLEFLPNLRHAGIFQMSTMVNSGIGSQFKNLYSATIRTETKNKTNFEISQS